MINAYEAMQDVPVGQRELVVTSSADGDSVALSFCDAGCGVTPEVMDRIFDAFYTTKSGGMGMGLSLCKSIADAHGGQISVNKNKDVGMTFCFSLPTYRPEARNAEL